MEISEELKVTDLPIVVTPVDPVVDPDPPQPDLVTFSSRRTDPQKDDLSQKTREAIDETNRLLSIHRAEQNQERQLRNNEKALLEKLELKNSLLSHPA